MNFGIPRSTCRAISAVVELPLNTPRCYFKIIMVFISCDKKACVEGRGMRTRGDEKIVLALMHRCNIFADFIHVQQYIVVLVRFQDVSATVGKRLLRIYKLKLIYALHPDAKSGSG